MASTNTKTKRELSKEKMLHMHRLMLDIRNFDNKVNRLVKKREDTRDDTLLHWRGGCQRGCGCRY